MISPDQIRDSQVRTNLMNVQGTRIHSSQIRDGRTKELRDGQPTICYIIFVGVLWSQFPTPVSPSPDVAMRFKMCATPLGLIEWLTIPEVAAWWAEQQ